MSEMILDIMDDKDLEPLIAYSTNLTSFCETQYQIPIALLAERSSPNPRRQERPGIRSIPLA